MKRLYRFLRSPKLAITLILYAVAYGAVQTVVKVLTFSSPFFLAPLGLLSVCTLLCALDRIRAAARFGPSAAGLEPPRTGLRSTPVPAEKAERARERIAEALAARRYRIRDAGGALVATRGAWAAWASPAFHLTLVATFLLILASFTSQAEGVIRVPIDSSTRDVPSSYLFLRHGPFFPGTTGLTVSASDFQIDTVIDRLNRGPTAVIALRSGDTTLASRRVYPNSALRRGPLFIHRTDEWGYAPLVQVVDPSSGSTATAYAFIAARTVSRNGAGPAQLELTGAAGKPIVLKVSIPASGVDAQGRAQLEPFLRFNFPGHETSATALVLAEGASGAGPGGTTIRFVKRDYYVALFVVNDWATNLIYTVLILACIFPAVALLYPPKRVWVEIAEQDGESRLVVRAFRLRRDPVLARELAEMLERSLEETER